MPTLEPSKKSPLIDLFLSVIKKNSPIVSQDAVSDFSV